MSVSQRPITFVRDPIAHREHRPVAGASAGQLQVARCGAPGEKLSLGNEHARIRIRDSGWLGLA
jgi:hypothetical protein